MNNSKKFFLGIDTSCYTTSCAIVDENGDIVGESRKLLEVKTGSRGLAQSNMVFQHTRALPQLIKQLPAVPITAIGVSAFPRREEGSYMPAFLVGLGVAQSLAYMLHCPLYEFSHQENHILAALREINFWPKAPFYSLHVSGGTTELLYSIPKDGFFQTELLGGSSDLNAGQFVDRIGVQMGLSFPAGPALEQLALKGTVLHPLKISLHNGRLSFAGPASEAKRRIERGNEANNNIAAQVFECIGRGLSNLIMEHNQKRPATTMIAVGGVMCNSLLRAKLLDTCEKMGMTCYFANPKYSSDNATGNAHGAKVLYYL